MTDMGSDEEDLWKIIVQLDRLAFVRPWCLNKPSSIAANALPPKLLWAGETGIGWRLPNAKVSGVKKEKKKPTHPGSLSSRCVVQ
jgi:hypothetical protein